MKYSVSQVSVLISKVTDHVVNYTSIISRGYTSAMGLYAFAKHFQRQTPTDNNEFPLWNLFSPIYSFQLRRYL